MEPRERELNVLNANHQDCKWRHILDVVIRSSGILFLILSGALAVEDPDRADLTISNGMFVIKGAPTFLLGISYFDAMSASSETLDSDLRFLKARGFNAIRVWATWYHSFQPKTISLIERNGQLNPAAWNRLERVLKAARRHNFVVDLTFSRDGIRPVTFQNYKKGMRAAVIALKPYPNVFIDAQNETNHCGLPDDPTCAGHLTLKQVASIRAAIKEVAPRRLITASRNTYSFVPGDDYQSFREVGMVDFIATHRPSRTTSAVWAHTTDDEVRRIRKAVGPSVPVLFDEPNRCDRNVDCNESSASNLFVIAAKNAKRAGAAGWFFHTDASFRLDRPLTAQLHSSEKAAIEQLAEAFR